MAKNPPKLKVSGGAPGGIDIYAGVDRVSLSCVTKYYTR